MIHFTVTNTAKTTLVSMIKKSEANQGHEQLIPAILWGSDSGDKKFVWMVGFYEKKSTHQDWLIVLDGVEFFIDPAFLPKLDGATLDYADGNFEVRRPS